jgi:hypothetical protein
MDPIVIDLLCSEWILYLSGRKITSLRVVTFAACAAHFLLWKQIQKKQCVIEDWDIGPQVTKEPDFRVRMYD